IERLLGRIARRPAHIAGAATARSAEAEVARTGENGTRVDRCCERPPWPRRRKSSHDGNPRSCVEAVTIREIPYASASGEDRGPTWPRLRGPAVALGNHAHSRWSTWMVTYSTANRSRRCSLTRDARLGSEPSACTCAVIASCPVPSVHTWSA